MTKSYAGFGLQPRSAFALPGMAPRAAAGLPSLELELETSAQLEQAWSGPASPQPWRGQLGDGETFTVEWGVSGDLRFGYGERASFRLDPAGTRLGCAPVTAEDLDWQRVLITRVLPNVSLARGREALHASAIDTPLGVVAIAAPGGMGKSTLALELIGRGWSLFADDTVVLEQSVDSVLAHPASPHLNLPVSAPDAEALGTCLADLAGEHWIAVGSSCDRPRPLGALVLLRARGRSATGGEAARSDSALPRPLHARPARRARRERCRASRSTPTWSSQRRYGS